MSADVSNGSVNSPAGDHPDSRSGGKPPVGLEGTGPFFCGPWPFVFLMVLALAGAFATGYLSYRHIGLASNTAVIGDSSLCRADGKINCDAVLKTSHSVILGHLSSAALGLTGFLFAIWCALGGIVNERMRKVAWVCLVVYFFAAIGFSWYFAYLMAFEVDYICTWCIVVHVINLICLITVIAVSIKRKKEFLLKERATLSERIYFVFGGLAAAGMVLVMATAAEKTLTFNDLKIQYEELANDPAVIMAVVRSSPTFEVPTGQGDPVFGAADAPHSIVFFSDFECPGCARKEKILRDIVARNPGVLKMVYKNYPLSKDCNQAVIAQKDFHPLACVAARAAYSAYLVGGDAVFWAYGELLFAAQKQLEGQPWVEFAKRLNLDTARFAELMKPDGPAAKKVALDTELGQKLRLDATPWIFFEGKRIPENFNEAYLVDAMEDLIRTNHPHQKDLRLNK